VGVFWGGEKDWIEKAVLGVMGVGGRGIAVEVLVANKDE
jgi:hypothetical protein